MGLLDLSKADVRGFDPIPAGTYDAEVFSVKMDAIKNEGKLPKGTPGFNVQFKIVDEGEDGPYYNRRVFNTWWIAPAKINGAAYDKKAVMDGMLVRFFEAIGFNKDEVMGGKFDPDLDELVGRECRVTVGLEPKKDANGAVVEGEFRNPVKGVKPIGEGGASSGSSDLL